MSVCVCVYSRPNVEGGSKLENSKSPEGGLCVLAHTLLSCLLLVSCCFVVSQSNVRINQSTNTLTSDVMLDSEVLA